MLGTANACKIVLLVVARSYGSRMDCRPCSYNGKCGSCYAFLFFGIRARNGGVKLEQNGKVALPVSKLLKSIVDYIEVL